MLALHQDRDGQIPHHSPSIPSLEKWLWGGTNGFQQPHLSARYVLYNSHEVYTGPNKLEYGEWMLSQEATRIQVSQLWSFVSPLGSSYHQGKLPVWATIIPIVLASDKTPISRQTGNLEIHPLFLTIRDICSDLHMKATTHAWSCVAYMPIAQFVANSNYTSVLQVRLWHQCMDIVCGSLKNAAAQNAYMADPAGFCHIHDIPSTTPTLWTYLCSSMSDLQAFLALYICIPVPLDLPSAPLYISLCYFLVPPLD